ncbi:hypothetical protein A1O1_05886 [Capronia coronata CBS 617.96]|uniref:DNA2/NAM7 helicase-like C-terminal domain-containing protein n=1 Tax=Capronia coronata CBS 617.96 TaxID=1182541 RepID=W9XYA9_9EURO|nr:uncharacterized protein A1O1_05886 [Capronia coronata CBS 617.96]EXJ85522.1 hypothetical protein A1O1_05886 [Capronia coronata CBS 617.96]
MAVELLKLPSRPTIALITGYAAQRNIYSSAKASMQLDLSLSPFIEQLHIGTVDSLIGKEFTYVIADILVGEGAGFMADVHRLCVLLSRARDGLVVMGSSHEIDDLPIKGNCGLKELMLWLKAYRVAMVTTGKSVGGRPMMPACRYSTPEQPFAFQSWVLQNMTILDYLEKPVWNADQPVSP